MPPTGYLLSNRDHRPARVFPNNARRRLTRRTIPRRGGFLFAMAGMLLALSLLRVVDAGAASLHPQDGPHADVRIRIEDDRVVYQIMMNLAFIDEVVEFDRENPEHVSPVDEPYLKELLLEFFRKEVGVTADGVEIQPLFREYEFLRPGREYLPLFPRSGMRGLLKARVVIDYPVKSPPQKIDFRWDAYPRDLISGEVDESGQAPQLVIAALLTAEGVDRLINFSEPDPVYTWSASGKSFEDRMVSVPPVLKPRRHVPLPALSIALLVVMGITLTGLRRSSKWPENRPIALGSIPVFLLAAALTMRVGVIEMPNPFAPEVRLPTEEQAVEIFRPLHANIYTAFDYTEESDVYDALEQSVEGEMLDALYNQMYRGLTSQDQGAAVSRIQSVDLKETEVESIGVRESDRAPRFAVRARWRVEGAVYHFGHSHTRLNEYEATYTVVGTNAGWRISDSRVIRQKRLRSEPDDPFGAPPLDLKPGEDI